MSRAVEVRSRIIESDLQDAGRRVLVVDSVTMGGPAFRPAPSSRIMAGARIDDDDDPQGVLLAVVYHSGFGRWCLCREYMSIQRATSYSPAVLSRLLELFQQHTGVELPAISYIERGITPCNALTGQPLPLQSD